jgi:DNA-binding response OmpR family regulator
VDQIIRNPDSRRTPSGAIRILVADNDPSIVRFLELYLSGQGFEIFSALTGEEGLFLARRLLPDVILFESNMPDLKGLEVLRRLQESEDTRRTPIVMFTAGSEVDETASGPWPGAADYVTKPFDIGELRARLIAAVARKREQLENTEAEKLKTVREVVASVSHGVNNPLAAILMCAEALEGRSEGNVYVLEKCRVIQENALRIRDVLKQLENVKVLASIPYVAQERILDLVANREERT